MEEREKLFARQPRGQEQWGTTKTIYKPIFVTEVNPNKDFCATPKFIHIVKNFKQKISSLQVQIIEIKYKTQDNREFELDKSLYKANKIYKVRDGASKLSL
jgi:hypothetical protein